MEQSKERGGGGGKVKTNKHMGKGMGIGRTQAKEGEEGKSGRKERVSPE